MPFILERKTNPFMSLKNNIGKIKFRSGRKKMRIKNNILEEL